jgi:hypothetical protein
MPDEQQLTIAAYKDVFSADDAKGQRVLDNLMKYCLGYDDSVIFDVNSTRLTDFNLGKNDVIRHIKWMLKRKTEQKPETVISERENL